VTADDRTKTVAVLPGPGLDYDDEEVDSRWRRVAVRVRRNLLPVALLLAGWELFSHFGGKDQDLFPPVEVVAETFWELLRNGILIDNTLDTLWRLMFGWVIACVIGVLAGFAMARVKAVEELLAPLVSILLPIPSLAWIPLFILWFGLGNTSVIVLIVFSAALPIILNTWTGMRSVNPVWISAAQSMDVRGFNLLRRVVLPASLPTVMTGLRIGLAQAWRAVVAGEMIAATQLGLGVMIFNSREFLNTDVMLAVLLVIGPLGLLLERVLFETVEKATIKRWGMAGRD
jgi:NitT/TauT family transport system permease protein